MRIIVSSSSDTREYLESAQKWLKNEAGVEIHVVPSENNGYIWIDVFPKGIDIENEDLPSNKTEYTTYEEALHGGISAAMKLVDKYYNKQRND